MDQERSGPPWTTLRHFPDAHQTVAVVIGLSKVEPQVAEPGMEVEGRYNRFALDLVPRDWEEKIWVPMITPGEFGDMVVRQDSGSPEGKWERMKSILDEERSRIQEVVDKAPKRIGEDLDEISCSGNEGPVARGVVVAESASPKAKRKKNKKKRKSTNIVEKEKEGYGLSEMRKEIELINEKRKENDEKREENDLILKDKIDYVMKMREEINRVKAGMESKVENSEVLEW